MRERIGHFLAHCRNANTEQVSHLLPGERMEIVGIGSINRTRRTSRFHHHLERQADKKIGSTQCVEHYATRHCVWLLLHSGTPYATHKAGKDYRGSYAAHCRCPCRALHAHCRTAEMSEDECIVGNNVQHVHRQCGNHRLYGLSCRSQRRTEGQRQGLEERQCPGYLKIPHSVRQQAFAQAESQQQRFRPHPQRKAHRHSQKGVDNHRYAHNLHESCSIACTKILRTEYGCSHRHKLVDEKHKGYQLVVESHGSHRIVAVTAQHHRIHSSKQHHEGDVDENRHRETKQTFLY